MRSLIPDYLAMNIKDEFKKINKHIKDYTTKFFNENTNIFGVFVWLSNEIREANCFVDKSVSNKIFLFHDNSKISKSEVVKLFPFAIHP